MNVILKRYAEWFSSVFLLTKVVKRLLKDTLPGSGILVGSVAVLAIFMALMPIGSSYIYSKILGSISVKETLDTVMFWLALSIAFSLSVVLMGVLRSYLERRFFIRITKKLTLLFVTKKSEVDLGKLEEPSTRDLITKAQERGVWPSISILDSMPEIIASVVGLLGAVSVLVYYNPWFVLALFLSFVPQFLVDVYYGKTLWTIWDSETEERRWYNENIKHFWSRSSLIELRLFQNVKHFLNVVQVMLSTFEERQSQAEKRRHRLSAITSIVILATVWSIILVTVRDVVLGSQDLQKLVFLWGSVTGVQGMFTGLLKTMSAQNAQALYANDAYKLMDSVKESDTKKGVITVSDRVPFIEFRDVWFKYPWTEGEGWVLKGVSFSIQPGEKVALVGLNGAGKTTLVKLLAGIYEPNRGQILIDGVSLNDISVDSWRKHMSVLFQDFTNYHGKVREIISYGDTSVPIVEQRLQIALKASGCDTFVPDMPRGDQTVIGRDFENGIDPSGGQKQRFALARVFYRGANLLILDEPTASLDAFAEMKIFGELESRKSGETIILITHRMFSVKNAEHIVVLANGVVAEQGDHHQLMMKRGVYREMFETQARPYMEAMKALE